MIRHQPKLVVQSETAHQEPSTSHDALADAIPDPSPEYEGQKQQEEETPAPEGESRETHRDVMVPFSSGSVTYLDDSPNEEMVITSIRATDIALGLRRVPAAFYAVVHHSGAEWRTENVRPLVSDDAVEWSGPIPIPSDLSVTINLEIYASFEFEAALNFCVGEQLRKLVITAEQLLDSSVKCIPFTLLPMDRDVVSSCSSISMGVEWRRGQSNDSAVSRVLELHQSITESQGKLEDATNHGHIALSRYRKYGEKRDLERSIKEFDRALRICPLDHPHHAAALSNLATAKFILCRVEHLDAALDIPLDLYRDALASRPAGNADRPLTLIQLAAVHVARYEKRKNGIEIESAEALLREAIQLHHDVTESHENRAATFMLQLLAECRGVPVQVEKNSISNSVDEDSWTLSVQLLRNFERSGDLGDLQRAITILQELVVSASVFDDRYRAELANLGVALRRRFLYLGDLNDLEVAISKHRDAVDLTPHGHSYKYRHLNDLGNSLKLRFESLGELHDLEEAISKHRDAVELAADGDPHKFILLHDLGNSLTARFEYLGELKDLGDAISILKDTANLTPHGHPNKAAYLHNLGNALAIRFERLAELSDLEDAISRHIDAVDLTPTGHPEKSACLSNLGTSFLARFEHREEHGDLENAIFILREAAQLTPQGHPGKSELLTNLGNALATCFLHFGELSSLEDAISRHKDAVDITPYGHIRKPVFLHNLANSFGIRFQRLGELSDLSNAISNHRDAVDLAPPGYPRRFILLSSLCSSLTTRFKHLGELCDIEDAISKYRDAVVLTPHDHPHKPACLGNLGNALVIRFEHLGSLSDLDDAISSHKNAVDLVPPGQPDKPAYLNTLGVSFLTRFDRVGKLTDLNESISVLKEAVDITPDGQHNKPRHLTNLASAFFARFLHLAELSDLEYAVSIFKDADKLTACGHPEKATCLHNLGDAFLTRFRRLGELSDLEESIALIQSAVDLQTPLGHTREARASSLTILGNALRARFARFGVLSDLEDAILIHRDAISLTTHGHLDEPGHLGNLGNSLISRFNHLGELRDLEEAISKFSEAVRLTPDSHRLQFHHLHNLGNALATRFERLGELHDLENAISRLTVALQIIPDAHSEKLVCLTSLGNSFFIRFQRLGKLGDLEHAISRYKEAVRLVPNGQHDKAGFLHNLGNSLFTRFKRLREQSDLEDAISMLRDAVDLTPPGHIDMPLFLHNLADSLLTYFLHAGEMKDLHDAVSMLRDALGFIPHCHPHRPACLTILGDSFLARFQHLGELCDLEDAISTFGAAVRSTSHGHTDELVRLCRLGNSLLARFDRLQRPSDLDAALSTLTNAIYFPRGHPEETAGLVSLGNALVVRFESLGELSDLEQAISLYSRAASATFGPINVRFHASREWIACARRVHHQSLLSAYSVAIGLLPQLAWIGLSLTQRYTELTQIGDVVWEAAAALLHSGYPETAVEWLEQARSIVWGELFQLRSSYEELSSTHPDYACRLRELSAALEHASSSRERSLTTLSEQTSSRAFRTWESLQQEADRQRTLAIERDNLLQEIRRLPGFEQFLLHKRFSQLRASAHSGPVVLLNAAESHCDALVVLANVDHVIHVPLPNFTFRKSLDLHNILKSFVRDACPTRYNEREGRRVPLDGITWYSFLSQLWKCIVKPILDALAFSVTPGDLSRIFWCPAGPFAFLPIHAAGLYDAEYSHPGNKVFDFVISSYVPTLSILAPSPGAAATRNGDLRLLAIRQPPSDGLSRLPGVVIELEHIEHIIRNTPSAHTILLEPSTGTVEEVLALMKDADWVHFACHGVQDGANSGLCLTDRRRLRLRDIIAVSRPRGGLAFLSACQTAMGEQRLSDEAIHMAAGMLFAGYGAVVGTMWSISDQLAPQVARDVYASLFYDGTRPDYQQAARALHDAVRRLRERDVSFEEWLPFIHVGI